MSGFFAKRDDAFLQRWVVHPIALKLPSGYGSLMRNPILDTLSPAASVRAIRLLAPMFACCGALGLFLAGCESEPESHLVSAPPPAGPTRAVTTTTVTTAPTAVVAPAYGAAGPAVSTIIVTEAPPAMQQEVVLAQPTSQHVWLPGYWTWRNDRYEWMAGHWELPPSSSSVWVRPRWEQQGNAYKFYEGYWN